MREVAARKRGARSEQERFALRASMPLKRNMLLAVVPPRDI